MKKKKKKPPVSSSKPPATRLLRSTLHALGVRVVLVIFIHGRCTTESASLALVLEVLQGDVFHNGIGGRDALDCRGREDLAKGIEGRIVASPVALGELDGELNVQI